MSARRWPLRRDTAPRARINREPSPLLARSIPWLTVMLASLVPTWLVIAPAPLVPQLGFLVLLAWGQLRPGVLPSWAGLPLGAFDDMFSGSPIGSAIMLWSIAMIVLELIELRVPWRNFPMEWLISAAMIGTTLVATALAVNAAGGVTPLRVILPQLAISVLVYPLVARLVAGFDRMRLIPVVNTR